MRPKIIIIHDNLLKKIYFIINTFADEKIGNYQKYYYEQIQNIKFLKKVAFNSAKKFIAEKKYTKANY